jgi:hypothetical protein
LKIFRQLKNVQYVIWPICFHIKGVDGIRSQPKDWYRCKWWYFPLSLELLRIAIIIYNIFFLNERPIYYDSYSKHFHPYSLGNIGRSGKTWNVNSESKCLDIEWNTSTRHNLWFFFKFVVKNQYHNFNFVFFFGFYYRIYFILVTL